MYQYIRYVKSRFKNGHYILSITIKSPMLFFVFDGGMLYYGKLVRSNLRGETSKMSTHSESDFKLLTLELNVDMIMAVSQEFVTIETSLTGCHL